MDSRDGEPEYDLDDGRFTPLTYLALGLLGVVGAGIALSQHRLLKTLADFGVELPAISMVAFNPLFGVFVMALFCATLIQAFVVRNPRTSAALETAACVAGGMAVAAYILGALMPYISLVRALSG